MRRMAAVATVAAAVFVAVAAAPGRARAEEAREEPGLGSLFGLGAASVAINLLYMPAKFLYACGGGLVGLMAWGVTAGDDDIAKGILQPAFGGSWEVTPAMLRGEEPLMFSGPTYEPGVDP